MAHLFGPSRLEFYLGNILFRPFRLFFLLVLFGEATFILLFYLGCGAGLLFRYGLNKGDSQEFPKK